MVDLGTDKKVSTPLPAVVGRERLKRGLLALAVEDGLSGTLLRGGKGTAKSTAVRGMADLLPDQRAVADCPYGCPPDATVDDVAATQCTDCQDRDDPPVETRATPLVTLPLGATRDRVVGTLSVADALDGDAEFDPGLLARANRGVLYVDEVNLLDDHLVDVLLDAAAMGINRVERDGVSVAHPAEFTLIGTMNPEEGELRPQLRDRFDLCVEVTASDDVDERVEILNRVVEGATGAAADDGDRRRTAGGDRGLRAKFADETAALRERVRAARERRPEIPTGFKRDVVELCRDAGVDGHRADFAVARAARAFAALDGRPKVIESDVAEAAEYALAHRTRGHPLDEGTDPDELIEDRFGDGGDGEPEDGADGDAADGTEADPESERGPGTDGTGEGSGDDGAETRNETGDDDGANDADDAGSEGNGGTGERDPRAAEAGSGPGSDDRDGTEADGDADDTDDESGTPLVPGGARAGVGTATAPDVDPPTMPGRATDESKGRGDATPSPTGRGATVRTERTDDTGSTDAAATVRAAARNGRSSPTEGDLRRSVRADDARTLTVFVADASASMAPAMRTAKGVVLELLGDAYAERDAVALVAVGGDDAEVLLPPTTDVSLAARHLKDLPTADRTPLPAGLDAATDLIEREEPAGALVVLVSDGRANVADGSPTAATRAAARRLGGTDASVLVVDAGEPRAGLLDAVCGATDADRIPLSALSTAAVADQSPVVRER